MGSDSILLAECTLICADLLTLLERRLRIMGVGEHRCPHQVQGNITDDERYGNKAHGHTVLFGLQVRTVTLPSAGYPSV